MTLCEMGLDHAASQRCWNKGKFWGQTDKHACQLQEPESTFRGWNLSREVTSVLCSDEVKALASLAWRGGPRFDCFPKAENNFPRGALLQRPPTQAQLRYCLVPRIITTLKKPWTNDPFPKPWALLAETLESTDSSCCSKGVLGRPAGRDSVLGHMRAWKWLVIFPLQVHTPPSTSGMPGHMPSLDHHPQGLYWRGAVSVPQFASAFVSTVMGFFEGHTKMPT